MLSLVPDILSCERTVGVSSSSTPCGSCNDCSLGPKCWPVWYGVFSSSRMSMLGDVAFLLGFQTTNPLRHLSIVIAPRKKERNYNWFDTTCAIFCFIKQSIVGIDDTRKPFENHPTTSRFYLCPLLRYSMVE